MTETGVMFDQVLLERLRATAQTYIPRELAEDFANEPDVEVSGFGSFLKQHVCLEVRQTVVGQGPYSYPTAKYPQDWKEAIKLRFAPAWFLDRWPVKWETVTFDARIVYPKIALPHDKHHIAVIVRKE